MFFQLLKLFFSKNKKTIKRNTKKRQLNKFNSLITTKNKPYIFIGLVFIILIFYSKSILVIPIFIFLAALSRLPQTVFPFVAGFDLGLFLTVIAGVAYGGIAVLLVGIGSSIFGAMIKNTRNMGEKMIFYIMMGVIGLIAPHIPITNILAIGMISTILYDIVIVIMYFGMIKKCIVNATTFSVTHIIFNWWLFDTFGASLLLIL